MTLDEVIEAASARTGPAEFADYIERYRIPVMG